MYRIMQKQSKNLKKHTCVIVADVQNTELTLQ